MAVTATSASNVQIAVTLEESFMNALPEYFTVGTDTKLHHDPLKVNVFAHKKLSGHALFADSYGEELKFDTPEEFLSLKRRLLNNPTFLHVRLEKERSSGNTRYITTGSFVVFINSKHPVIQQQLMEKLVETQRILQEGKHVALEIKFGNCLKGWFKANFQESWASYSVEHSNFCITNYSQRFHECYNPIAWIVCLPCCLLGGPCYCIHRKMNCVDLDCTIHGHVQYTAGINAEERRELILMLARAYAEGMNDANHVIAREPAYPSNQSAPPPPYSVISSQVQQPKIV